MPDERQVNQYMLILERGVSVQGMTHMSEQEFSAAIDGPNQLAGAHATITAVNELGDPVTVRFRRDKYMGHVFTKMVRRMVQPAGPVQGPVLGKVTH